MAAPNPVFGKIFVASTIEQATKALLLQWLPTFIREIESQQNLEINSIEVPKEKNYTSRNSYDALPGDALPRVVIISPGLIGQPVKSGNGQYRAIWRLGIGVACVATDEETAKLHGDIYGAAVRDLMLKRGGGALGGKVEWIDEQYVDLPISNQLQQYRAAANWFSVDIDNVATKRGGPDTPDAEPYAYKTANTVDVGLIKEAVDNG